jgi:hypothetical protein
MSDFLYYHEDTINFILLVLIVLVVVVVSLWGIFTLSRSSCTACTKDIGFPHRWSIMGGCQIEIGENKWIPLDNYRLFGEE